VEMGKRKLLDFQAGPRNTILSTRACHTAKDPHEKCIACTSHVDITSKCKKKVKDSNEHLKYGSVSEKLLNATAESQKLEEELSKLLNMEFPIKLHKNKSISEIVKSTPKEGLSEEKPVFFSDCSNRADSMDSVSELSEPLEVFKLKKDDINPGFVSQKSETSIEENCASELVCSAAETEDLHLEVENQTGQLQRDTDDWPEKGDVELQPEVNNEIGPVLRDKDNWKKKENVESNLEIENRRGQLLRDRDDLQMKENVESQLDAENKMGHLLRDTNELQMKENVETKKDFLCMNPNAEFKGSIQEENDEDDTDDISHLWRQMLTSFECSKDPHENEIEMGSKHEPDCNHSFLHKEDLGHVCRFCGLIGQRAEEIFDFEWSK
ncbi:hypothetical protein KI387_014040, partial [Taxus chinensis]